MKKILNSLIISVTLSSQLLAGGGGFAGATEITQILNNVQLGGIYGQEASQYATQIREYATQLQQYETQINQLANQTQSYNMMLSNIGTLPQGQWQNFVNGVMQLKQAMEYETAISYASSNYDTKFKNQYPGYNKYLDSAQDKRYDFGNEYKKIADSNRDTVNASLKSLNLQQSDLESDESIMQELNQASLSAEGQKSAIQATNAIALHQTQQLKKLQTTLMTQANLQAQYMASENEKKELERANSKAFIDNADTKPNSSNNENLFNKL